MPSRPVHPGEILGNELAELGMTAAELAGHLRLPHKLLHILTLF